MYRQWSYLKEKEDLDILPAVRSIFGIFYIHGLLNRINAMVRTKGIEESASLLLGWGFIVFNIISAILNRVEDKMYFLLSIMFLILSSACLFHPVEQLNQYWEKESPNYIEEKYNITEIIFIVIFSLIWCFILIGLYVD
jgi:hypothetical protein